MDQTTKIYTLIEFKTFTSEEEARERIRTNYSSMDNVMVISDHGQAFYIVRPKS